MCHKKILAFEFVEESKSKRGSVESLPPRLLSSTRCLSSVKSPQVLVMMIGLGREDTQDRYEVADGRIVGAVSLPSFDGCQNIIPSTVVSAVKNALAVRRKAQRYVSRLVSHERTV